VKINQYCSVCKKHLDMDLVPTDDGGDDGVIWLRCPECRGFLPKFSGEGKIGMGGRATAEDAPRPAAGDPSDDDESAAGDLVALENDADEVDESEASEASEATAAAGEPVAEYAAALAAADVSRALPYRSSGDFAVGEVIFHLAWDDCGIVVAKETLPGNRRAIKVYFATVGVVHLIEQSQDVY
jgi:hypothetical protein